MLNQYLEFTANPHYFGGVPKIQTIFFKLNVSAASAVAQIQSGELDLALDLNPADAPQVAKAKGVTAKFVNSVAGEFLQFRVTILRCPIPGSGRRSTTRSTAARC